MTSAWKQDPPLEIAELELIYRGEIIVWIESGTGNVARGGKARQMFVAPTVLEECLESVSRWCDWQLVVEVSAVKM